MDFKIGDTVKFIDEVGGGKIVKIIDKNRVMVSTSDGFEYPHLANKLIKTAANNESNKDYSNISEEHFNNVSAHHVPNNTTLKDYIFSEEINFKNDEDENIYLSIVPDNISNLENSEQSLYIINDSNWHLLYVCQIKKDGAYESIPGTLQPNYKEVINSFTLKELIRINEIIIQIIFLRKTPYSIKNPINKSFKISNIAFIQPQKYKKTIFFNSRAIVLSVLENSPLRKAIDKLKDEDISEIIKEKEIKDVQNRFKPIKKDDKLEIDIHIDNLLDNTKGMDNKSILDYQLDVFKNSIKDNLHSKHIKKIVFIHGKGEGTLKAKIRGFMDLHKIKYQDASFRKYGYGATLVFLDKNIVIN